MEDRLITQTTDGTATNQLSIVPPSNSAYKIWVETVAVETGGATDGAANFVKDALIWNDGGTIAQVSTTTTIASHASANAAGWSHVVDDASAAGIRIRITGVAARTIDWHTTYRLKSVST